MAKEFEELIYMVSRLIQRYNISQTCVHNLLHHFLTYLYFGLKEQHLCSDLSTLEEHIDQTMIKATVGAHEAKTSSEQTRKQQEEVKQRNEKISAHKTEIGAIERKVMLCCYC